VHAGEPATALDVVLERRLLGVVEDVTGGGQEDDDLVLRQVGFGERGAVFGGVDGEVVLLAEFLDGRDPGRDRRVTEARRLGKDQRLERRVGGRGRVTRRGGTDRGDDNDGKSQDQQTCALDHASAPSMAVQTL
jgi:hypothetical protein